MFAALSNARSDIARWRANLQGEADGIAVYRAMAKAERDSLLAEVYTKMADAEERHAGVWTKKLSDTGASSVIPPPSWRGRVLVFAATRLGPAWAAPTMAGREAKDQGNYDDQPEARGTALPREERSHARLLREITGPGLSGARIARIEGRHRTGGNALRAAVLGINDGLVSNFCLVMGVAGATADARAITVAGLAGLLAGSISMALGEWLSVQSARELYERQIAIESEEIAAAPDEEEEELALIYRSKGIPVQQARVLASQLIRSDKDAALDALTREELGIDPEDLGGSAWVAAGTSFGMFAVGALVPLIPFAFATGAAALIASAVLSGAALFVVGALITVITGQPALRAGLRQLAIGIAAAAVTFSVGRLLGTTIN